MQLISHPDRQIILPETGRQAVLAHCRQALARHGQSGGAEEGKAFGLVCGMVADPLIAVASCLPLRQNVRSRMPYKKYMDDIMREHAVPSETPLSRRGWVADPAELAERLRECRCRHHTLLGTYHMHRVGWAHDPVRDTPTRLDAILARESRLLMFIVSMVDPERPIIRAFYEGRLTEEIPISPPG